MQNFHNILYVSHALCDETQSLRQALDLVRGNRARLRVLVICPEFPETLAQYRESFQEFLIHKVKSRIHTAGSDLKLRDAEASAEIDVVSANAPAVHIIRQVLSHGHDLVLKQAEPVEGYKGFKPIDLELLRKCPCPVWLCRVTERSSRKFHVAVAVDPQKTEPEARGLALRLLTLARSLVDSLNGVLTVVSCWDFEFEAYLRYNAWVKLPENLLQKAVLDAQIGHRAALERLIGSSRIKGAYRIEHIRGRPEEFIPVFIEANEVDLLLMGTVARTGVPGLIIGNTAENLLHVIRCSLIALKPIGFVSPVKAY